MSVSPLLPQDIEEILAEWPDDDLEKMSGASVLISGISGFIGRSLFSLFVGLDKAHQLGLSLWGVTRDTEATKSLLGEEASSLSVPLSLVSWTQVAEQKLGQKFDFVVHAASATGPKDFAGSRSGFIEANFRGTSDLLGVVNPGGVFLFLSSVEIYGASPQGKDFLAKEDQLAALDPWNSRSAYAIGKLMVESLGTAHADDAHFRFSSVRLDHVFGPAIKLGDGRVLGDFFSDAVSKPDITLLSDGSGQIRLTYVSDALSGIMRVLVEGESRAYNLCAGFEPLTLRELGAKIVSNPLARAKRLNVLGQPIDTTKYLAQLPPGLECSVLRTLGWAPRVGIDDGISRVLHALSG